MRPRPIGQALRHGRFSVCVAGRTQTSDEQLRITHLAGQPIHYLGGLTSVVDEHLLARQMGLAHGRRELAIPAAVVLTELRASKPVRMNGTVLFPQQR